MSRAFEDGSSFPLQPRNEYYQPTQYQNQPHGNFGATYEEVLHPNQNFTNQPVYNGNQQPNYNPYPANSYQPPPNQNNQRLHSQEPLLVVQPTNVSKPSRNVYRPFLIYLLTVAQVGAFCFQLYNNYFLTGSVIQTQPFNFLIGPTPEVLIHQGGRFVPCMKVTSVLNQPLRCPAASNYLTGGTASFNSSLPQTCKLVEVCGFDGFTNNIPDQWFRFILPIFLHGGVLHILFNLLAQVSLGVHLERVYGAHRIFFIYFAAGVGGFILGSNLAPVKINSVGASGAIFGLIACDLVDLVLNWNSLFSPWCELFKVVFGIIVTFAIGLLPIVDNFSHIGGFLFGLLMSGVVLPTVRPSSYGQKRKVTLGFLALTAMVSGVLLILAFYFGIHGFYYEDWATSCPSCKYLNCIPVAGLCDAFST